MSGDAERVQILEEEVRIRDEQIKVLQERAALFAESQAKIEKMEKECVVYLNKAQDSKIELERKQAEFSAKQKELEMALEDKENKLRESTLQLERLTQSGENEMKEIVKQKDEISSLTDQLSAAQAKLKADHDESERMRSKIHAFEKEKEETHKICNELNSQIDLLRKELSETKLKVAELAEENSVLQKNSSALKEAELSNSEKEAKINLLTVSNDRLTGLNSSQEEEIKRLSSELSSAQAKVLVEKEDAKLLLTKEKSETDRLQQLAHDETIKAAKMEQLLDVKKIEAEALKSQIEELEKKLVTAKCDVSSLRSKEEAAMASVRNLESENSHLKRMIENLNQVEKEIRQKAALQFERAEKEIRRAAAESEKLIIKEEQLAKLESACNEKQKKADRAIAQLAQRDKAFLVLSKKLEMVNQENDLREKKLRDEFQARFEELNKKFEQVNSEATGLSDMLKNTNRMYELKVEENLRLSRRVSQSQRSLLTMQDSKVQLAGIIENANKVRQSEFSKLPPINKSMKAKPIRDSIDISTKENLIRPKNSKSRLFEIRESRVESRPFSQTEHENFDAVSEEEKVAEKSPELLHSETKDTQEEEGDEHAAKSLVEVE